MDEAWLIYYEELHDRAADVPEQEWEREQDMAEAVHDAYEATVARLTTQHEWPEEDALTLTRGFGQVVKEWMEEGEMDWDELRERLEATQIQWDDKQEPPPLE